MVGIRLRGRLDRNDEAVFLQRMSPVRHFAAFAALQFFGSYRTNNGHHRTVVRRGSVAIDPLLPSGVPAALNSQFQLWARATNAASAAPNKMERRVSLFILRLQSAWMLCSRATGPHNRICSLTNFRSSSGPPSANVTCWVSLSCLATPGSRNDAASSSANLLTIALGVPAGAKTPH